MLPDGASANLHWLIAERDFELWTSFVAALRNVLIDFYHRVHPLSSKPITEIMKIGYGNW